MRVFLTGKFKLRPPTGRKAKVLVEVKRLYAHAITEMLALAKEDLPRLQVMTDEERKGRGIEKALRMPRDVGAGLHSSLRNAAKLAVAASVQSYIELSERAAGGKGEPPSWPCEAQNDWPDYEDVLNQFASLANNEERETELRNQLGKASFRAKEERRGLGDILWFPAMDAPFRSHYGGLVNDGQNWFAFLYVLAPEHPLAKVVKGNGTLYDVENRPWTGYSKCALILPLEIDRHDWQHKRWLNAYLNGEAKIKTGQLYQERNGDWSFAVQSAWQRSVPKPERWLGLAFEGPWPILSSADGHIIQLAGSELQAVAKLALLLRASMQQRGKDVSCQRVHGTTSKQVVYLWANAILEIAQSQSYGIAITGAGRPILGVPRARLNQVLDYKGVLAGVSVRFVSSKDAAWVCPQCGTQIEKAKKPPWPTENECKCGKVTSIGARIAWHLARRAEEKYRER